MNSTGDETPFMIQAPPGIVPAEATDESSAAPSEIEAAPLITLPPGIALPAEVADSATHRLAPAPRQSRVHEEIVFLPSPIGVPAAPVPATATAATPAEPDVEKSAAPTAWRLDLGSGVDVIVADAVFVGRNPAASADRPGARLVPVSDPAKSVSKTHALFEVHDDTLYVHDLDSTNGTRVTPVGAAVIRVEPGRRIAVLPGSTVELGDFPVAVTRVKAARGT